MNAIDFSLHRNAAGRLALRDALGHQHDNVIPVRAFPLSAPEAGLSLLGEDGHELRWIADLAALPAEIRTLISETLAQREFMPEIRRIHQVSSFATPSTWQVNTHVGDTQLWLKSEDQIRRLDLQQLLISDGHGLTFLIRDIDSLDRHSRKLLDRFL